MRFRPEMKGVTPILMPSHPTRCGGGPYVWPAGPYPHIQAAKGRDEIMMWAAERNAGGRGFGFTGGHVHSNWGHENFRRVVANAILWIAKVEVPPAGAPAERKPGDLQRNLEKK